MALGPRLDIRQSQSLVMTPQLQQAIKLLALSNIEVETFIGEALEANPLLDIGDSAPVEIGDVVPEELRRTHLESSPVDQLVAEGRVAEDRPLDIDATALDRDRDTGDGARLELASARESTGSGGEGPDIDEHGHFDLSLAEHLHGQIGAATSDAQLLFVARWLIDQLDEAGYLRVPLSEVAEALGLSAVVVERALGLVQSLDPTGVGARNLAECIALQAKEADRYDPCMARLIDNLELVARGEIARLKRMCNVDDEDFADMLAELRSYDPRPGLRFGGGVAESVVPDILIRSTVSGGWDIAINQATLPRLIVNRS
ncbi:MAG TPA: RNA polymerase sigma-54 factor, partial [Novosphingobium sp.]|nr:RNA polymerase sigma-54 factor [Novosphingobium sp.]